MFVEIASSEKKIEDIGKRVSEVNMLKAERQMKSGILQQFK